MRSFSTFLALLFALFATSYAFPSFGFNSLEARKDHNGTRSNDGDSAKQACRQIQRLTHLTALAANQTKLDEFVADGKMNTTEVDTLKAKAADAITKLQAMESNSTLTAECATINAAQQTKQECRQMRQLQKLAKLANNQTAMDAFVTKMSLNGTQVDKLKEKVAKAETKLQTLSSNSTLTGVCASMKQEKGDDGTSGTAAEAASSSSTPEQTKSNGADGNGMMLASLSYVMLPALGLAFAVAL